MVLTLEVDAKRVKRLEKFMSDPAYKDYLEQATAFNRKLNEERKMRIPYIDGQTGVAQRHYHNQPHARQRMPPTSARRPGQVLAYPQKPWRKRSYQYLKFFLAPRRGGPLGALAGGPAAGGLAGGLEASGLPGAGLGLPGGVSGGPGFDPDAEMHTISQIENPTLNDESNHSSVGKSMGGADDHAKPEWYYEDDFEGEGPEDFNSDSDFEYEDYGSKKKKGKGKAKGKSASSSSSSMGNSGVSKGGTPSKRRTHADNIPDSEKPFSCERPSRGGSARKAATVAAAAFRETSNDMYSGGSMTTVQTPPDHMAAHRNNKTMSGKDRAPSLGYCDFCLGDATENKKTTQPEELVSCAECGRSGHPTCLQFSPNMLVSVKEYPWQCIECKCCTLCGTSENDDQLLFCDDCDRGYHMYCLIPPIKEPPEGSWSCKLCLERFHRK
ncbi:zinc finger protein neuro-d4-like isoform X2 [Tigriopus californicus]|uniref:zinc finger protein neuro-d4-like isoform X2 n=1 Tax=Tigriopus californicus TaxID=6832 RepID=UPI0027DA1C06|nr:zinc finger protein neuro-d4-like isoform X2 [Tigriopus californicus]|eukprot:TCALIF_10505-PA protein Name:"Similar to dpf3 Zinc finger protein DPF3 (Danio rerio)" AED:0.15 eAED:0.15 QI:43/1/1/1/0.6/1/6/68/438